MNVVFTLWGDDLNECARLFVASCKKQGYIVWQLSPPETAAVPGVDCSLTEPMRGRPGILYRAERLADLSLTEYVAMDADMIVVQDISPGFDPEYDVSLSWRPEKGGSEYNGGLIFVRNRRFMRDVADKLKAMPADKQEWWGDQLALQEVARSGRYLVKELRGDFWNMAPSNPEDRRSGTLVYHFKGARRKAWMPAYAVS